MRSVSVSSLSLSSHPHHLSLSLSCSSVEGAVQLYLEGPGLMHAMASRDGDELSSSADAALQQLLDMGFDKKACVEQLAVCDGDPGAALENLLMGKAPEHV